MLNRFLKYEDEFRQWVRGGYPGIKSRTLDYIRYIGDPGDETRPREGVLWPHQWDSLLRVVYAQEIRRDDLAQPDGVLLNIVTGGGKTAVIAATMVWLRLAHDVQRFVVLCPNLIVRDRLEDDFENGKVFVDRRLIPPGAIVTKDDFALTTLGSDRPGGWANLLGANVVLGNIHQFYQSNRVGQGNLANLMNEGRFALFNDEAHNSPAPEWDATLDKLRPYTILRLDTTATPDRADDRTPDSQMIYEYGIRDALADRLVKAPVVYQPNIATVELTYTDSATGKICKVEEIDWDEVDRKGISATQWVTDDKPMQQQMRIALARLREQERRARGRYQPVLFVVAVCKLDAEKASRTLNNHFKVNTLLVTEDSGESERRKATDLQKARKAGKPYKAVVSVLMLREGWDVPEVGVILLLRKFSSKVYGQQVIGRGLRRVRLPSVADDEPQICAVVDHPKLKHQWLWDIFNSRVRPNVGVDDEFDETEDEPLPLERQELVDPTLIIEIPEPLIDDPGEFIFEPTSEPTEPLENWPEVLEGFDYPDQTVTITDVDLVGVERQQLTGQGWQTLEAPPASEEISPIPVSQEDLAEAIKNELLKGAESLLANAGHTAQFTGRIYQFLLRHVRSKFLDGASLGLAEGHRLETVWRMLPVIEKRIAETPGMVEGMVKYGGQ